MANRTFHDVKAQHSNVRLIVGSFRPNGSSAVATTAGIGYSVVRTSAGLFTVTLTDSYPGLLSGHCSLQLAAGGDQIVQFGEIDVVTAKTVQIRVWDISDAAVADIASNANNWIHFTLCLKNTSMSY